MNHAFESRLRNYFGGGGSPTPISSPAAPAPIPTPPAPASQPSATTQVAAAQRLYAVDNQGAQTLGGANASPNKTGVKPILGG